MIPDDTICAIATAPGGAARGIVRISGGNAIHVAAQVFRSSDGATIEDIRLPTAIAGCASVALHGDRTHTLPCDAFLWPTARSYTREPVAELHTIGSPPLLDSLMAAICRAGARIAEPGEFTLRAFLAGRIDLTQAEAVLGVIDARSSTDLSTALTQLAGGLAKPFQQLRNDLLQLLAELEAGLDFVEEDIKFISKETLLARLNSASQLLDRVAQQMASRGVATAVAQVVLVGPPNAGKSSLFNAIVARFGRRGESIGDEPSPAIVSPRPGTTRDYLTATIEIDGARFELLDTAGVDANFPESLPGIDRDAQSLAAERRATATVRAYCVELSKATRFTSGAPHFGSDLVGSDIVVFTKADLMHVPQSLPVLPPDADIVNTSSRTGEGLDELCNHIRARMGTHATAQQTQSVASTAERCRESVRLAQSATMRAYDIISDQTGDELAASELRIALAELGKIVGAVYTEDLLDRVFSTFCIGK